MDDSSSSSSSSCQEGNIPIVKSWCNTHLKLLKHEYIWIIDNFSFYLDEIGVEIESAMFSASNDDKNKWFLKLYRSGELWNTQMPNHFSLDVVLASSDKAQVKAEYKCSIMKAGCKELYYTKKDVQVFTPDFRGGFRYFIPRDSLLNGDFLSNDKLVIYCELNAAVDCVNYFNQDSVIQIEEPKSRLSFDLGKLFEAQTFSDVTLSVCGREFRAHKNILVARSQVFAAMFNHSLLEKKHNRVDIKDIDGEVLQEMLRYIYTGKANKLDKLAFNLLVAADKYALEDLKAMCEVALSEDISIDRVADILILADLHSAEQLKAAAITFINNHAGEVMKTAGWQALYATHKHLLAEAWVNHALKTNYLGLPLEQANDD